MKLSIHLLYITAFTFLVACSNGHSDKSISTMTKAENTHPPSNTEQQNGIVGDWEQQYTCFDKNGNNKLDPEEKKPSNTRLGFDWFQFNADGSCLRDKEIKFKSTYELKNKGNTRELTIRNVHSFTIVDLTDKELIMGDDGAFMVFKKIK